MGAGNKALQPTVAVLAVAVAIIIALALGRQVEMVGYTVVAGVVVVEDQRQVG